jgi:hypothetical protein
MTPFRPVGRTHDEIARESGQRFAAALPEPVYLISLHHADEQRTRQHHWPLQRIEQATAYLRARNARRWHIHGRPWSARHVLVDDLTPETLERLAAHHLPAAVVATSPGRLQAWLTLSASHIAPEHARAVARLLARRYGGDPGATSPLQPGRWPGYTNPKPGYRDSAGPLSLRAPG